MRVRVITGYREQTVMRQDPLDKPQAGTVWCVTETGYQMPPRRYLFETVEAAKGFVRERLGEPDVEFVKSNGEYHPKVLIHDYGLSIAEAPIYGERKSR